MSSCLKAAMGLIPHNWSQILLRISTSTWGKERDQGHGKTLFITGRNPEQDRGHVGGDPPADGWLRKGGGEGERGQKEERNRSTPVMVCGLDDTNPKLHSEAFGHIFGLIWPLLGTCDPISMWSTSFWTPHLKFSPCVWQTRPRGLCVLLCFSFSLFIHHFLSLVLTSGPEFHSPCFFFYSGHSGVGGCNWGDSQRASCIVMRSDISIQTKLLLSPCTFILPD